MIKRNFIIQYNFSRKFIKIDKERKLINGDSLGYVLNPLNAFLIIKRLSIDVNEIDEKLDKIGKDFKKNSMKSKVSKEEFEGASDSLVRLQTFYNLEPQYLAKGIIQGQKYRDDLTSDELLALSIIFRNVKHFSASLSYLGLAFSQNRISLEMPHIKMLEQLYQNYKLTGRIKDSLDLLDQMLKLEPGRTDLRLRQIDLAFPDNKEPQEDGWPEMTEARRNISKVCSSEMTQTDAELSKLHCRYVSRTPFSKLARFKVEEANLNPYVAIYHEVISDNEIEIFKLQAKPALIRAGVLNNDASSRVDKVRVAKLSWHQDKAHKIFERLSQRVGDMTGLNMNTAEDWQVQNYGIGGHYDGKIATLVTA